MNRIVKISIVFFLMISICFSMIACVDTTYEEKNVIVKPGDYRSNMLWLTSTDRETQFTITSDYPVNVYIMTRSSIEVCNTSLISRINLNLEDFNTHLEYSKK